MRVTHAELRVMSESADRYHTCRGGRVRSRRRQDPEQGAHRTPGVEGGRGGSRREVTRTPWVGREQERKSGQEKELAES